LYRFQPLNAGFSYSQTAFCELLLDVVRVNRQQQRMQAHEFIFMPNHVHLLITPAPTVSLEKAIQFIKGGFSYRARKELAFRGAIWNPGFNEHRIRSVGEYATHVRYTHMNPVKAGKVSAPEDWPYTSARLRSEVDSPPGQFRFACAKAHSTT
jgi:putative transposase